MYIPLVNRFAQNRVTSVTRFWGGEAK